MAKTQRPMHCDFSQIKKIKPEQKAISSRVFTGANASQIHVGVKEFMDQQATDCMYGEKLQNRLAINRINLFTESTQESQIRGPYLQSTGAGGKVFPSQLDSINQGACNDHIRIQQESSQPQIIG